MQEILIEKETLTSEQLSLLEVAYKWVDKNYNDFFHYWGLGTDVDWIENDITVFVSITSTKWQSGTITITLMNNYDDAVICAKSYDYDTKETDFPQSFEEFKNQINK